MRILWLDLLRTLAILMMIVFHTAFDLQEFHGWDIDVFSGAWDILRIATGTLFIGLSGLSTHYTRHPYKRAGRILAAAAFVSIATFVWDPETFVRFGILHLIGVSVLLLPVLNKFGMWNIAFGAAVVTIGNLFTGTIADTHLLIPFGFLPPMFATLDYYPLLPWSGIAMIGYGIGFAINMDRQKIPKTRNQKAITTILSFPGRHALGIYLLHQPVIIAILDIIA